MAGGLTISTLNDSSGVLATQNGMKGIAKAWANFGYVASAITIRDSFNISSITRNGTGSYTLNFTTAMANANYCITGSCVSSGAAGANAIEIVGEELSASNTYSLKTTSAVKVIAVDNNTDTYIDSFSYNVSIFGS